MSCSNCHKDAWKPKSLASLMAVVVLTMSFFSVGNYILCAHDDGAIYLEKLSSELIVAATAEPDEDCKDENCSDTALGIDVVAASNISLDEDAKSSPILFGIDYQLTTEAICHNGWGSDPPPPTSHYFVSTLKPTIILVV